jgi:hypothetical protein
MHEDSTDLERIVSSVVAFRKKLNRVKHCNSNASVRISVRSQSEMWSVRNLLTASEVSRAVFVFEPVRGSI